MLERAAAMRKMPTEPERRIWMALRTRRFSGHKFRRQAIIGMRIVDFFCPAKGLIIEIDGETHDPQIDARRDAAMLRVHGFRTLRFNNLDVISNMDGVLIRLQEVLSELPDRWSGDGATTPQPPPLKRRGSLVTPSSSEEGVGGGGINPALRAAAEALAPVSDTSRLDAELLMAHALGVSRSDLLLRHMADQAPGGFAALLERRLAHEPVAHILGQQPFFGLDLKVSRHVLIPRGDSEVLVEQALALRPNAQRVLDCGTGSGALLLAVLANLPQASGIGIDRCTEALDVARENAVRTGLALRADMRHADWSVAGWADALGGQFDLVLANPPYVEDNAALTPDVRNHEPAGALFAGPDGLDAYRILVPQLPALLAQDGAALVEIGATQADAVAAIAAGSGLCVTLHRDLASRPRVLELVHIT